MREKRNLTRWRLIYYLRVFDDDTGAVLGHVVDITAEGMMLVSSRRIPLDHDFRMRLEIPTGADERETLRLTGRSVWSDSDPNQDFYDTGFRFNDPSEETVLNIQEIIEALRFPGPNQPVGTYYGIGGLAR